MQTFRSDRHPGTAPAALVYARALVRPLATCLLPVMIVATLLVLTGMDPLAFLAWSTPLAYVVATAWTLYDLGRIIAEIRIRDEWAAVLSVWEVARTQTPDAWRRVWRVREDGFGLLLSHGRSVIEIRPEGWPEYDALDVALREACEEGERHPEYLSI